MIATEQISGDQFWEFEQIRMSGICNMMDTRVIMEYSDLTKDQISIIRKNYSELADKYM